MGRKAVDRVDPGLDGDFLIQDPDDLCAVDDLAARRPLRLEPDEDDAGSLAPQVVPEVMLDPSGVGHAARGDDDGGTAEFVDGHGLLRRDGKPQLRQRQRIFACRQKLPRFLVEIFPMIAEDLRGLGRKRAVDENGHVRRETALLRQEIQGIDELLGPLHGKGGDDDLLTASVAEGNGFGQFVQALRFILVIAVSVGGFQEEDVGLLHDRRVFHHQLRTPADVAGKDDLPPRPSFFDPDLQERRPEDMSRVLEDDPDSRGGLEGGPVVDDPEKGKRIQGVLCRVERIHPVRAEAKPLAAFPLRFHLLDMGAVQQHDLQQIPGRGRRIDAAPESILDHPRQEPGVVDMGVGHQEKIDFLRLVDRQVPIPFLDLGAALMHPAVDREPFSPAFDNEAGAGHGPGGAHTFDLHEERYPRRLQVFRMPSASICRWIIMIFRPSACSRSRSRVRNFAVTNCRYGEPGEGSESQTRTTRASK
ncbi:MAG: hypothetical protein A4E73_02156 [Syntrophaceae bacterium PtaU1.Bin231]|nr:MAG: hypothetical protein A4E73_02156 [Syntrophaceae bacterium PtaU1.Bin231]